MPNNQPIEQYSNLCTPFSFTGFNMSFTNLYKHYFDQLIYIAMRLIVFDGLPDTIDETFLKYTLLCNGKSVFFKLDQEVLENRQLASMPLKPGDVVALNGSESNMETVYYMHRNCIVNNSAFGKSYVLTPGKDCEIVYCTQPDRYKQFGYGGLFALIARTATILADNDISINCAQKNTRLVNLIGADDTATVRSAEVAIQALYNGDPYKIVQSSLVSNLQGIPMTQKTATNDIVQLIEMRQYVYSHFYEALGLQTHDNMKKERLITEEINDNEEISALNIDDILVSIKEGLERVNKMFDLNITADLNKIVQRAHEEDEKMLDNSETDPEEPEEDPFKYYDSAEMRRIIYGLKAVLEDVPEPDPDPEQEPDPDPEQEPDPDPEQEPDPDPEQEPDPDPEQEPDPDPEQQPDPDPEQQPDPDPEQEPDPDPEQEPDPDPEQEPDPDPEQEPDPDPEQPDISIEIHAEDNAAVTVEIQQPDGEEVPT